MRGVFFIVKFYHIGGNLERSMYRVYNRIFGKMMMSLFNIREVKI